ncbi:uncharacterized protein FA14DRAFT_71693 [Meira miltonrushii]|uniref:RING-type domain-containing protein n=1 Tax=Meira miltonrushii TaxID=1280837 RepID=A0A316VAS2_9BASI|nr:uncharacterized protein FA14DRAFT_71693 [Meira miltonrushii]PWN34354.1 hypothetical protein FA14DRAFT_71693 [Meira miltonrushii]
MQPQSDLSPLDPGLDLSSVRLKDFAQLGQEQNDTSGASTRRHLSTASQNRPTTRDLLRPSSPQSNPPRFRLARTVTNKLFRRNSHQSEDLGLKRSRSNPNGQIPAYVRTAQSGPNRTFSESNHFVPRQTSSQQQWFNHFGSEADLETPRALATPRANVQSRWPTSYPYFHSQPNDTVRPTNTGNLIDGDRPYISEATSTTSFPRTDSSFAHSRNDFGGSDSLQHLEHLFQSEDRPTGPDYFSIPTDSESGRARDSRDHLSQDSSKNSINSRDTLSSNSPDRNNRPIPTFARDSSRLSPEDVLQSQFVGQGEVNTRESYKRSRSLNDLRTNYKSTASGPKESRHPYAVLSSSQLRRINSDTTHRSRQRVKPDIAFFGDKVEPLVLRLSAFEANRLVGLITSASNSNQSAGEEAQREEPIVSFSILKPLSTTTPTKDPDMAIGEKSGNGISTGGGWRSRFGGGSTLTKQRQANGSQNDEGSKEGNLLNRFMLDKKPSAENLRMQSSASGSRNEMAHIESQENQVEREMAAQHIARQQRTANDARLANMIPLLDGITPQATAHPSGLPTSSPHYRIDEYRKATKTAPVQTKSKADRMMGGQVSNDEKHSLNTDTQYETRSRSNSDVGPEEVTCPVCLELLSFRLAGEKAHVVPLCGHALHHACFTAVYGSVESVLKAQSSKGNKHSPPGMCGVCRRLIVLGEDRGDHRRVGKAAGMMGVGSVDSNSIHSEHDRSIVSTNVSDDPLEVNGLQSSNRADVAHHSLDISRHNVGAIDEGRNVHRNRFMLLPSVKVRPEFETVYRKDRKEGGGRQNLVCVVTVGIPSRRQSEQVDEDELHYKHKSEQFRPDLKSSRTDKGKSRMLDNRDSYSDLNEDLEQTQNGYDDEDDDDPKNSFNKFVKNSHLHMLVPNSANSSREQQDLPEQDAQGEAEEEQEDEDEGFSFSATPAAQHHELDSVVEDLRNRIIDWKGHSVERFGALSLYNFLGVRQDSIIRNFYVYLFRDALLCVNEEKKKEKGLARLIYADRSDDSGSPLGSINRKSRAPLKLKGRIWLRHIKSCQNTEIDNMPCLSIRLDDDALDNFILSFKDRALREKWRVKLNELLAENQSRTKKTEVLNVRNQNTNGGQNQGKSRKSPESPALQSAQGDASLSSMATRNTSNDVSLASSHTSAQSQSPHTDRHFSPHQNNNMQSMLTGMPSHQQWSASGGLDPNRSVPELLPHTPIDLVIMVSVPSVTGQPSVSSSTLSSSAALKVRLIRSTLDFVINNMGPRDRIAIVAYHVGVEGAVRRTALLNTSKKSSVEKLEQFVDSIGKPWEGPGTDPFKEDIERLGGNSDRTDTVTAVNVGFDIILQRKSKNPITGMLLINDTADAPKRGQMDLVMARAEAANVPVHCFGFGKSHDPSSLWLISNHTHGSYTFVREWYQLRECVAGCIGALMSIALTDVRLHISVPSDNHFRVRKVTGITGSIISTNGKDVDLDLGEMRFGELRELFFELEFDFSGYAMQYNLSQRHQNVAIHHPYEKGSATDDFMMRLGLNGLSITGQDREQSNHQSSTSDGNSQKSGDFDGHFVDEVAVLEVQCGCRDPSIGMGASRLPDPCVLTIEIDSSTNDPSADGNGAGGAATALADPVVTRRRLEILVSDMITRCLLLVSRRNQSQALTILMETRKIVDTVLQAIPLTDGNLGNGQTKSSMYPKRRSSLGSSSFSAKPSKAALLGSQPRSSHARKQRERLHKQTAVALMAMLDDLDVLIDGLETGKALSFDRSERNFGAQQAMVLRDQKAWTSRSDTEWQFFKLVDNGSSFAALAAQFAAGYGQ